VAHLKVAVHAAHKQEIILVIVDRKTIRAVM
jgi:hypothetical protein